MSENIKLTREDGTDFRYEKIEYEVGKVVEASDWIAMPFYGRGLDFGRPNKNRYILSGIPFRAFKVEPIGTVVEISLSEKKAQKLRVLEELDSSKLLSEIARDKDSEVREAVARHPNTSEKTLSKLVKDEDKNVSREAVQNLKERE